MNKVESFSVGSMRRLEDAINELAEDYEIINVSIVVEADRYGTSGYSAMVLYKL